MGSSGDGNGNSLQYSFLENPMDRGAWRATVHRVSKSGYNLAAEQSDVVVYHTELNKVLCDNLEEWDGVEGGVEAPEGEGTCILMAGSLCCMAEADIVS